MTDGVTGLAAPEALDIEVPRTAGSGIDGLTPAPELSRSEHFQAVREGRLGSVHSWELVTAVDGPGNRMTLFLAGCPLRCLYCHNPDTLKMKDGEPVMVDDIMKRVLRYRRIFQASGGGLTISGGEPMMQPAFLKSILREAKKHDIHTAIDTSGNLGHYFRDEDLDDLDLVLLDVKSGIPETYRELTGRELQPTIDFGDRLAKANKNVWIRFVVVPGWTDAPENIDAVAKIITRWPNVERLEVLPFHQMGRDKWETLGLNYQLDGVEPPGNESVDAIRQRFRDLGVPLVY
ncbi:pyruvate formate-lyase-activating protein [Flaviflexus massiliensis]|uniref:pyruvate formate-lyase-activating protein n=1 Tax=Flaviflexus massiliensis TaxID=1522309 RepID=UPI0006D54255|nr:pyruvate formate-lyase-activating protein [Flaviflexus massiliensis]